MSRRRSRSAAAPPAARLYEDDGIARSSKSDRISHRTVDRRTRQLCGQVFRILATLLPECHDDVLRDVAVGSVTPAPDASRLLITLQVEGGDPAGVMERLERVRGFLRQEVAAAVQRKRAPDLVYLVLPAAGVPS